MNKIILNGENAVDGFSVSEGDNVLILEGKNGDKIACPILTVNAGDKVNIVQLKNGDKIAVKTALNPCSDQVLPARIDFGAAHTNSDNTEGWYGITYYYKLPEPLNFRANANSPAYHVTTTDVKCNVDTSWAIFKCGAYQISAALASDTADYTNKAWNYSDTVGGNGVGTPLSVGTIEYTSHNRFRTGLYQYLRLQIYTTPFTNGWTGTQVLKLRVCP